LRDTNSIISIIIVIINLEEGTNECVACVAWEQVIDDLNGWGCTD